MSLPLLGRATHGMCNIQAHFPYAAWATGAAENDFSRGLPGGKRGSRTGQPLPRPRPGSPAQAGGCGRGAGEGGGQRGLDDLQVLLGVIAPPERDNP